MEKTYKVSGKREVHGTAPGETFSADLDPAHEQALIEGGFIRESKAQKPDVKVGNPDAPAAE